MKSFQLIMLSIKSYNEIGPLILFTDVLLDFVAKKILNYINAPVHFRVMKKK